ncbi:hypothetical protein KY290_024784 [Solanum tuberosum]|uniref:Uncharacterized protein n=1 Tax=Solanum tuberosum TaxID=4113 RepID=A0ABQ7URN8_SOLTU|nr:hypothetical protein KY284_023644 [Solanum tuberosum]KAH0754514.1 hypothetical protein KY290_024784 [Solanum tuberosum]
MAFNGDFQEKDVWSEHVVKKKLSITSKMIPIAKIATISNNESTHVPKQSSAPINIPYRSKIYKKKSSSTSMKNGSYSESVEVDEDCDDIGMLSPHEYLAKRVARSQIDPPSMSEGVGRTRKGRDLSKMRNAILTKTGFLEKNN